MAYQLGTGSTGSPEAALKRSSDSYHPTSTCPAMDGTGDQAAGAQHAQRACISSASCSGALPSKSTQLGSAPALQQGHNTCGICCLVLAEKGKHMEGCCACTVPRQRQQARRAASDPCPAPWAWPPAHLSSTSAISASPASTATVSGVWCSGCSWRPPLQGGMMQGQAGSEWSVLTTVSTRCGAATTPCCRLHAALPLSSTLTCCESTQS